MENTRRGPGEYQENTRRTLGEDQDQERAMLYLRRLSKELGG